MTPARSVVAEVLQTWREAERLLDELPPISPDHETVRLAVHSLRATYRSVSAGDAMLTPTLVAESHERMAEARALLTLVRKKQLEGL